MIYILRVIWVSLYACQAFKKAEECIKILSIQYILLETSYMPYATHLIFSYI